jgi:hypothetical protein
MLQSELMSGASLEALALLLASSYALAERALGEGWLTGGRAITTAEETEPEVGSSGALRRAEALRPRGLSHSLSRVYSPRIVRIRGQ